MRKILLITLLLIATYSFAQTDRNGNPVFNSVNTNDEAIGDFQLSSNYYLLKSNIENNNSSGYISDNPTLNEIENSATNLPSDFFIISKNQGVLNMVMIRNSPNRQFFVINPNTNKHREFPCHLKGDISENRANEIIKENYDRSAKIKGDKLHFNNHELTIISNKEIKSAILNLIKDEKLSSGEVSEIKTLSKEETKRVVLEESKEGGKLDFFTEIVGHEYDGIQVKPGVFDTKIGIALYQWGRANFEIGVNTYEDALTNWEEHKGRVANAREKEYIKMGFNKELEK